MNELDFFAFFYIISFVLIHKKSLKKIKKNFFIVSENKVIYKKNIL